MAVGECRIDALDRGFLFGDAVYEVVPVYAGRMFEWVAHFERLARSLLAVDIDPGHTCEEWESILGELIRSFEGDDLSLYLQITRGVGPRNHMPGKDVPPTVFAMAVPMQPLAHEVFQKGVAVVTGEDLRWTRCDIKTTSLISNVMIKMQAMSEGVYDMILLRGDSVTESSAANVFVVRGDVIATTPVNSHILPGITRGVLITLARQHGIEVRERKITAQELKAAEEIWLSSSTREIVPITRLDGQAVGKGVPGPMWETFRGYIKAFVEMKSMGSDAIDVPKLGRC